MKLRTIIIDDERPSIEGLIWELKTISEEVTDENTFVVEGARLEIIGKYSDPREGLKAIKKDRPDLIFLDIEMPHLNGFELLNQLDKIDFNVIFVTAYDEFALKAFKVSAVDYLLKPIDSDDLRAALGRASKLQDSSVIEDKLSQVFEWIRKHNSNFPSIALPTLEGLEFVDVDQIIRCESDSNYTNIFVNGGEKILVSKTLKDIEKLLQGHHFLRVHHSHVVNMAYVKRYIKGKSGNLVMKDGTSIPVSRSRKIELLNLLTNS